METVLKPQVRPRARPAAAMLGLLVLLANPATPAFPEETAPVRGDTAAYATETERLFHFLAMARNEAEGRAMEGEIWRHWMLAPDAASADLMARATERRRNYDLAGAIEILDELVERAPDWAEGWNQRATVRFMQGDFEGSLADIEETLQREPRHFGSLAGMAIILMQQGRAEQAQATLRRAIAIHPFLRERGLIVPLPGEDI
jgi:tetratricopeptide (TPR) repeat protein